MFNINSNKQKKGKPKMFLLFLLIAAFIWFLSKFSRDFTASIDVEVVYINTPHGIIVSDKNQNDISFDLTASGFDFLSYKINRPKIHIDLGEYYNHEKSVILIPPDDFKKIIANQLICKLKFFFFSIEIKDVEISFLLLDLIHLAN